MLALSKQTSTRIKMTIKWHAHAAAPGSCAHAGLPGALAIALCYGDFTTQVAICWSLRQKGAQRCMTSLQVWLQLQAVAPGTQSPGAAYKLHWNVKCPTPDCCTKN
jgi:hypothetical protein